MRRFNGLAAAAVTLGLAACGSADSPEKTSASQSQIPEALEGTWQTTIDSSRVVDAPHDLTEPSTVWRLKFLGTGGKDNGPAIFLSNEQVGDVAHPISLSGDEITLQSGTDCTRFDYVEIDLENLLIRSTEQDRGCPSTFISSVLQRPWRLVEGGPSRREPTTAEGSLASREGFVDCAQYRRKLGTIVGFRDGRVVAEPGQDVGGAEFDSRVSSKAIADLLAEGGQYVGLRDGVGPDVDIFFHGGLPGPGDVDGAFPTLSQVIAEAWETGIVSSNQGDYSELGGDQGWVIVRLEGPPGWDEDLVGPRVPRALKHLVPCFRQAVRASNGLVPAPGPLAGVWRTDPITVDDMSRTLRAHGLAKWVGRFAKQAPIGKTPKSLVLEIDTRNYLYPFDWRLYAEPEPGSRKVLIDYRGQEEDAGRRGLQYEQHGDELVVSHEGDANAYRWSVRRNDLTLTWQKTTYPPHLGIPEEVFQRALYMTAEFKRVS
jgi:hypothetical protein